MNRRELLGTAATVPFISATTMETAVSAPGLLQKIESRWTCVEGPPRAYFEGVHPSGEFGRAVYMSFVNGLAITPGDYTEGLESEAIALESLWKTFDAYAFQKKGKLYWRSHPSIERVTPADAIKDKGLVEVTPGFWQTEEVVEDGLLYPLPKTAAEWGYKDTKYYARMRLIITDLLPYIEHDPYDGPVRIERPSGEVWQRVAIVQL